jgi:DNA polymerase-3 subunit epsilon
MRHDRQDVIDWARALMRRDDWVVLDSETTGLDYAAEACQIAVVSPSGETLLDTLCRPSIPIPPAATGIHHITNAMVERAPTFADIAPLLRTIVSGRTVVIYNAAYDTRVLEQSAFACGLAIDAPLFGVAGVECAMEKYAVYYGDWSEYFGAYKFRPLPGGDHTAAGDCLATLNLIRRMAGIADPVPQPPRVAAQRSRH